MAIADLLGELTPGHRLATELQVDRVRSWKSWSVKNAHRAVAIIDDVNVDVAAAGASNVTCYVTISCLGGVDVNDALLTNGDRCSDAIYVTNGAIDVNYVNQCQCIYTAKI